MLRTARTSNCLPTSSNVWSVFEDRVSRLDGQARVLEMANQALALRTTPAAPRVWLTGITAPDQPTSEETHSFYNMLMIQVNAVQITQLNKESSTYLQDLDVSPFNDLAKYSGFRRWHESNRDFLGPVVKRDIDEVMRRIGKTKALFV